MSKWWRFAAAAAAVALFVGAGCKKNSAPEAPSVAGPRSARPGDTLTFRFSSADPDGDSISYMISWGDGIQDPWGPGSPSGEEYAKTHTYSDSGTYYVKAKARDGEDAASGWSDSIRVRIGSFAPEAPILPIGPTRCSTGVANKWSTKASHPLRDSVQFQFSWGDGNIDSFGHMVANNAFFDTTHTYSMADTYTIRARARDAAGFESPWSESLVVIVDSSSFVPKGAPTHLALSAATDSTVRITWKAPTDTNYKPSAYVVLFREIGTPNYDSVETVDTMGLVDTVGYVHNPLYRTGNYRIKAKYSTGGDVTSVEAPSTTPYHNSALWVPELSDTGVNTGYGWNRTTGEALLYDMTTVDSAAKVDFYFTDFALGSAGPNFYVASPDTAPLDQGGSVPFGSWRRTDFSHLDSTATAESTLPRHDVSRFRKFSLLHLDSLPRLVASFTTRDSHYALLRVVSIDTIDGTAGIETWFQKIKGLRQIEH